MTIYPEVTSSRTLLHQVSSLLLYQSVLTNEVGEAFINLLNTLHHGDNNSQKSRATAVDCLQAYGNWFRALATKNQSWQDYLIEQILQNENPFSQQIQKLSLSDLSSPLIIAVKHDLKILQGLYNCSSDQISQWVKVASQTSINTIIWDVENSFDNFLTQQKNWENSLEELANYYQHNGIGIWSKYHALRWQEREFIGIANPDPIKLTEIVGYESQKETLIKNTEILLAGYPALNVLLYGSRGTGKSSLVKSLLHQYSREGLRLIEISKSGLKDRPMIIEKLRILSQKFIIFVDDLSFEEDDESFKYLKFILEGSLTAKAVNTVVYATSNRRHLVREYFSDRPRPSESDEIHNWDTVQEKLSFSDRFGLTLTFEPANQETYLKIVHHLAQQAGLNLRDEDLEFKAKQWATRHNGRSGRTARQFIDFITGELAIES